MTGQLPLLGVHIPSYVFCFAFDFWTLQPCKRSLSLYYYLPVSILAFFLLFPDYYFFPFFSFPFLVRATDQW